MSINGETVDRSVFVQVRQVAGEHIDGSGYQDQPAGPSGRFTYEAEVFVHPPMVGAVELEGERAARQAWDGRVMDYGRTDYQYGGVTVVPEEAEHIAGPEATDEPPLDADCFKIRLGFQPPEVADRFLLRFASALLELADMPTAEREYPVVRIGYK